MPDPDQTARGSVLIALNGWGRGRLRQTARRMCCAWRGHSWGDWAWHVGLCGRACKRNCGAHHIYGVAPYAVSYDDLEGFHV